MEMQKCLRCGEELPFTNEYFNYRNKSKNILAKHCKKCQKEYDRKSKEKDGNKTETITIKLTKKEKKQIEENAKKLLGFSIEVLLWGASMYPLRVL